MMRLMIMLAAGYNITAKEIGLPTSTGDLGGAIANALKLLMSLVGMLAIVYMVYGGFLMVMSRGNPAAVQKARETLIYSAFGVVLAIAGFAIVSFITGLGKV